MWATPGSQELHEQIDVVSERTRSLLDWAGHDLEVIPTHDNHLALLWGGSSGGSDFAGDNAGHSIDPRSAGKCLVIASALNSNARALAKDMGGHLSLAWRFLLTHEIAHCVRNPERELRLADGLQADPKLLIAAKHAAEMYADGMAVIDLWSQDPQAAVNIARGAEAWRLNPTLATPWRTADAIERLLSVLPASGISDAEPDPAKRDRLAWQIAIDVLTAKQHAFGINPSTGGIQRIAMLARTPSTRQ